MMQATPLTDAYRDDLAYIHDAAFGGFARAAAPVLLSAAAKQAQERIGDRSGLWERDSFISGIRGRI